MNGNEIFRIAARDVILALGLLTRLPLPRSGSGGGARAGWAYPLAGLAVGALAALAGGMASAGGLPAPLAALVALSALIMSTGALHEDGLADTVDGLWGGWTRERRLEIMKDSRIGAYGVIALVLSLCARWAALWLCYEAGAAPAAAALIAAAALSRAPLPALTTALPNARGGGLSHAVGRSEPAAAAIAAGLGAAIAIVLTGTAAFGAILWAAVGALAIGVLARIRIAGQTGDILGAAQQIAEIAILFSLVA